MSSAGSKRNRFSRRLEAAYRKGFEDGQAAELPQDVIDLVIAGREFWGDRNDMSAESYALDKALEKFSSRVPYEDDPDLMMEAQSTSTTTPASGAIDAS